MFFRPVGVQTTAVLYLWDGFMYPTGLALSTAQLESKNCDALKLVMIVLALRCS